MQKIKLTLFQKIILKIDGRVFIENRAKPGWRGTLPFYAFKCDKHGLVEDYFHGYEGRLDCPKCAKEDASNR
jgi:hypothetical protein